MYTCRWCGKMLTDARNENEAICAPCVLSEAETYKKLARAMSANPGMNAMELSKAAGVPLAKVTYFMKNGKIRIR